jgi:pyridoxal phosphate enzyme (YggS family)
MLQVDEPALTPELIRKRLDGLGARLRETAERARRDPDGFRIVAVTKGFGIDVARMAIQAGLSRFGENRVQEALPKVAALADAEWHLVGHLQSNKARSAVGAFDWIHSVDGLALLARLEAVAHDTGRHPELLLQVNLSLEETRSGFDGDWFAAEAAREGELVAAIRGLRHVQVSGLMTMARVGSDDKDAHLTFGRLRELRDRLQDSLGSLLPELSMGMTSDAEAAVAEGATIVRLGSVLYE